MTNTETEALRILHAVFDDKWIAQLSEPNEGWIREAIACDSSPFATSHKYSLLPLLRAM